MGPHTNNHKLLICCSHLASGGKKVTQAAVHLLQLGDQAPQVALGALREEFLRDGGKKRLGLPWGQVQVQPTSPNPDSCSRPSQADRHPKNKPQTHSTGFVLPQQPLALLHELDVLVVPLPGALDQLQALQQEILLLFQLLHVLQLRDRARRGVTSSPPRPCQAPADGFFTKHRGIWIRAGGSAPLPTKSH